MGVFADIFYATIAAATPLIFAALGELVVEKSGVINIGIEGMMLMGAVFAFWAIFAGLPIFVAVAVGAFAGCAGALLFGVLTLTFLANQYAVGLALAIFGSGLSALIGRSFSFGSSPIQGMAPLHIPVLSDIPILGPLLFRFDSLVYLSVLIFVAVSWFLYRTRLGLALRTVGESPETAHAIGLPVIKIRYAAVLFGGLMAGLAGAYLSVAYTGSWAEDMTAGRGWIALALVVFSTWRPERILVGAWLFGGVTILQLQGQALGLAVPSELLSALPYIATIVVLVLISRDRRALVRHFPKSLGQPFRPSN
jgi:general nucleoside transport system permease protein